MTKPQLKKNTQHLLFTPATKGRFNMDMQFLKTLVLSTALMGVVGYAAADATPQEVMPIVGDFNGDGKSDVLMQAVNQHAKNYLTVTGSGTSRDWEDGYLDLIWNADRQVLVSGDFNGDGRTDIIIQSKDESQGLAMVLADESGALSVLHQTLIPFDLGPSWQASDYHLYAADFNGDGRDDVLLQPNDVSQDVSVGYSNGSGQITELAHQWGSKTDGLDWEYGAHQLVMGDFNGDGFADILFQTQQADDANAEQANGINFGASGDIEAIQTKLAQSGYRFALSHLGIAWDSTHSRVLSGDQNGDSRDDLFVIGQSAESLSYLLLADEDGHFNQIDQSITGVGGQDLLP